MSEPSKERSISVQRVAEEALSAGGTIFPDDALPRIRRRHAHRAAGSRRPCDSQASGDRRRRGA
eukprot:CAMPEP_0119283922 /NCGR_PEP_ID=MMETSP1329-20130426/29424_1 /TAXON_ID=114041 /ORGANISM="Genus nov. species nov., Strain RCC1024" /LENGTH=63 /DNA_ID=CAMNT_0007284597 /DNA_START=9 /DNA_END=198 /DNA_ORIENTATION=+